MIKESSLIHSRRLLVVFLVALFVAGSSFFLSAEKGTEMGYLGVRVTPLSQDEKEDLGVAFGVMVTDVVKDQAADKAGILEDDVILYFNGEKIRRTQDLVDAVRDTKPGQKVTVQFFRKGKKTETKVTVGKYESPLSKLFTRKSGNRMLFFSGSGYLGVQLHQMDKDLAKYFGVAEKEGALILHVVEESPAEKAGLKAGDVIVAIGKQEVTAPEDVRELLSDKEKGDKVDISVVRHKKKTRIKAELGHGPKLHSFGFFKDFGKKLRFAIPKMHFEYPEMELHFPDHKDFKFHIFRWDEGTQKELEKKMKDVKKKMKKRKYHLFDYITI